MNDLGNSIYLNRNQYKELIRNGSITVNGITVKYSDDDTHIVPLDSNTYSEEEKEAARELIGAVSETYVDNAVNNSDSRLYRHNLTVDVNAYGIVYFCYISRDEQMISTTQELFNITSVGITGYFSGPVHYGIVFNANSGDKLNVIYNDLQTEQLTITGISDRVEEL